MGLISDFAKSVVMGQIRAALPVIGGGAVVLGVQNHVNPESLEGAIYYLSSSLFYIVPAIFSYLQKHSLKDLIEASMAAKTP